MNTTARSIASHGIPDSLQFTTITYELLRDKSVFEQSTLAQFPSFGEYPQLLFE